MSEIKPVAWLVGNSKDGPFDTRKTKPNGWFYMEGLIRISEHQEEIDRLRDELDKCKSLVNGILDNRHKCFIPTDDPSSPTFNWDERANAVIGESA